MLEQRVGTGPWRPLTGSVLSAGERSGALATSTNIGPLQTGVQYQFRVAAENKAGLSTWTKSPTVFVAGELPGSVANLAAQGGDSEVLLTWAAPTLGEGTSLARYQVDVSPREGTVHYPSDQSAPGARVSGLRNGVLYTFTVNAVSTAGSGAPASVTATPLGAPRQVSGVSASPAAEGFTVNWAAPGENGSVVTNYLVEYASSPAGPWSAAAAPVGTQTFAVISSLSNTTRYYFRVAAVSDGGIGPWSEPASAVREVTQQHFVYVGKTDQSFTVPEGVTSLTIDMAGAQGGGKGTPGSRVLTTVPVTPGQLLIVQVGQKGQGTGYQCALDGPYPVTGGWPGGGDGGAQNQPSNCVISPGGGGGYSGVFSGTVSHSGAVAVAGGGGGTKVDDSLVGLGGGHGGDGTLAGGGAAGLQYHVEIFPSSPGGALQGGAGGGAFPGDAGNGNYPGGGGGGGYFGGGGGGSGVSGRLGGHGGAGSSYSVGQYTVTSGYQYGNGYVTLTW